MLVKPQHHVLMMLALTMAVFFAVPSIGQAADPSNVVVDLESVDSTPWTRELSTPQFCFLDDNGDGSYSPGEPVSLRPSSCSSLTGAVRVSGFQGLVAGRFIGASDLDGRTSATSFSTLPFVRYLDADNNGRPSAGDQVYLDVLNADAGRVEVGDVRLTSLADGEPGVHVQVGDSDIGSAVGVVGDLTDIFAYSDVNGNSVFDLGDQLFLRTDGTRFESIVHLNDLRLGGTPPTTFGTWVALGDADAPGRLRGLPDATFCLLGDASYEAGDTVLVRPSGGCTAAGQADDLALSGPAGGARLSSGDGLVGMDVHTLDASIRFREGNGFAGFGVGDGLYLELVGTVSRVDAGDVRLTPWKGLAAAAAVREGDLDLGIHTDSFGSLSDHASFLDVDGDGSFDAGDLFYLDRDATSTDTIVTDVDVGDTRLGNGPPGFFFGSQVTTGSPELVTRALDGSFVLCILDEDGDGVHDVAEAVYLMPSSCDTISGESLRLMPVNGEPAGSFVGVGGEAGHNVAAVPYDLAFHDADLSGTWTTEDTLYVHFGTPGSITVGDLRLSGFGTLAGGRVVASTDADLNVGVVSMGSSVGAMGVFVDADHTGAYSRGDLVYLDPAQSTAQSINYGMLRLTPLGAAQEAPEATPSPSPTGSPTVSPSPTDPVSPSPSQTLTDSPAPNETADGDGDDDAPRTPGPALALVLAAIGAVLWSSRRR